MKVKLLLTTKQYDENNNEDVIKLEVDGEFYEKNNSKCIIYKDQEATNSIIIKDNKEINIKKFGKTKSNMTFCEKKQNFIKYQTMYGIFDMKIYTNSLKIFEDDKKMILDINYNLEIKDLFKGYNILNVIIKKS